MKYFICKFKFNNPFLFKVLNETFPDHTFLMNGIIMGIKGFLSFLSAPLIGALSDVWGRKFFLLITVFFTCAPIPLMTINTWWFFAMISISGIFAVTFSVVFAYVADVTEEHERSLAYGLVSVPSGWYFCFTIRLHSEPHPLRSRIYKTLFFRQIFIL